MNHTITHSVHFPDVMRRDCCLLTNSSQRKKLLTLKSVCDCGVRTGWAALMDLLQLIHILKLKINEYIKL